MKTLIEVDIFDDPEFCNGVNGYCERLEISECYLFLTDGQPTDLEKDSIVFDGGEIIGRMKCDKCKSVHNESKENKKASDQMWNDRKNNCVQ